jgi:hypothetical protein
MRQGRTTFKGKVIFNDTVSLSGDLNSSGDNNDFGGNVIVRGNFTVRGTQTIVHSQDVQIDNNTITLNANLTGSDPFPTIEDSGLVVNRGIETKARLLWIEPEKYWVAGLSGSEERLIRQSDYDGLQSEITDISSNYSTKVYTDAGDFFEEVGGTIQPKASLAGDSFRIGSVATTYTVSGIGASVGNFISTTKLNLVGNIEGYQTGNLNSPNSTSLLIEIAPYYAWRALDGVEIYGAGAAIGGPGAVPNPSPGTPQFVYTFATGKRVITSYDVLVNPSGPASQQGWSAHKLWGWNGASWVQLDSRTSENLWASRSAEFTIASPGEYSKYGIEVVSTVGPPPDADYLVITELRLFTEGVREAYVYSGTAQSFPTASLVLASPQGTKLSGDTTFTLAYSVNGGAYSSYITYAAFLALGTLSGVTDLKIKINEGGYNYITSLSISTPSSELVFSPAGTMTANINGVPVWVTTADGDQTSVDMSVASLSASSSIIGGSLKSNTSLQLAETTAPISASNIGQIYTKSDHLPYFKDGLGVENSISLGSTSVVGPISAGNGDVALFDGTTGKIIKDSGVTMLAEYSGTAPNWNSSGTEGQMYYNSNYMYYCIATGISGSGRWVRWVASSTF